MSDALKAIADLWLKQIERAKEAKKRQFGNTAERAWKFYGDSEHKFLFDANAQVWADTQGGNGIARPCHPIAINMCSEYVRMMLPFVHAKNPARVVSPRRPSLPPEVLDNLAANNPPLFQQLVQQQQWTSTEDKLRAHLLRWLLNYTPELFDLGGQCRQSVTEGLVTGMGVAWHQMSRGLPVTVFDSQANLLWDPDAEQQQHCSWVARFRSRPAWQVAEEFGIPKDSLKGAYDSHLKNATDRWQDTDVPALTEDGRPERGDVVQYWEIYSRMGVGDQFLGVADEIKEIDFSALGPHVFLAVMPGMKYPLNLHTDHVAPGMTTDELRARLSWPIAFWGNEIDPWPCTTLEFLKNPRQVYPTSPLAEALPLQEYLDYLWSSMMNRVIVSMRDLVLVSKALDPVIREAMLTNTGPLAVVPHNQDNAEVAKYIYQFEFAPLSQDAYKQAEFAQNRWRESTGLMELMYGASARQMRSSAEVQIKQQNMSTRPEDMADMVEGWHCRLAAKEAVAARLHVEPRRFAELAGETFDQQFPGPLAQAWGALVNTPDPYVASDQMSYTVEAGSGRKPNPQREQASIQALMQVATPVIQQQLQMGNPALWNAFIHSWGKAEGTDVSYLQLQPPPPPQPMPQEAQQGPPPQ